MAKKSLAVFTAAISTLLLATAATPAAPVSATTIINDQQFWSVEELLELKVEADAELEAVCHGDFNCEDEFTWSRIAADPKYLALNAINHYGFYMTRVNPGLGTITLLYQNMNESWMNQSNFEENERLRRVGNLYLFWLDENMNDPLINMDWTADYVEDIKNGTILDGLHPLLVRDNTYDGTGWLPDNRETMFQIDNTNLSDDSRGIIYYWLGTPDPDTIITVGSFLYQTCLLNPDYQVGMDCRLMIGETGEYIYVPSEHKEYINDDTTTTINDDEPVVNSELEPETGAGDTNIDEDTDIKPEPNSKLDVTKKLISSPNTGQITFEEDNNNASELPWGIITLLFISDAIVLWWFSPRRRKNQKKVEKKSCLR